MAARRSARELTAATAGVTPLPLVGPALALTSGSLVGATEDPRTCAPARDPVVADIARLWWRATLGRAFVRRGFRGDTVLGHVVRLAGRTAPDGCPAELRGAPVVRSGVFERTERPRSRTRAIGTALAPIEEVRARVGTGSRIETWSPSRANRT